MGLSQAWQGRNEEFVMKTIQHDSHSRIIVAAFAAVLLPACLWLAGTLNAQDPKINAAGMPQSSVQGVVSAIDPEGQSTPLEGISLRLSGGYLAAQAPSAGPARRGRYW